MIHHYHISFIDRVTHEVVSYGVTESTTKYYPGDLVEQGFDKIIMRIDFEVD